MFGTFSDGGLRPKLGVLDTKKKGGTQMKVYKMKGAAEQKQITESWCCVCVAMGGQPPRPSCFPNPCPPGQKCTETVDGISCAPCPDGTVANGTSCQDVDEVRMRPPKGLNIFLCH